jgi:hypothetical protein
MQEPVIKTAGCKLLTDDYRLDERREPQGRLW